MNPVIGLDVSKGESQVQAFLDKGKPYRKSFSITHDLKGLGCLLEFLQDVEKAAGGHYHIPVIQFLEEQNYVYIIVNPLISHRAMSSSLRKVKTDAIDAYHLCELFYKEELEPYKKRGVQLLNLRNLTRQQESIAEISAKTKIQLHSLIDQVFPEYRGVFGSLYSKVSLLTLLEFPTSKAVLSVSEKELTDKIASLCMSRSESWAKEKAQKLREAALRDPFQNNRYDSHIFNLEILVKIVLQYQEHLSNIADEIDALASKIEEYEILQSIPGVGEKIAATIISEIGEIDSLMVPRS
jgi:transposase